MDGIVVMADGWIFWIAKNNLFFRSKNISAKTSDYDDDGPPLLGYGYRGIFSGH